MTEDFTKKIIVEGHRGYCAKHHENKGIAKAPHSVGELIYI